LKKHYSKYIKQLFIKKFDYEFPLFRSVKTEWCKGLFSYDFLLHDNKSWKLITIYHNSKGNDFSIGLVWSEKEEF